ncbi:hypothetical protein H0E87_030024 [Populus deltoides]|uniref:Uncharacterized protein n=1 Tax=Populus deltoides TaxID=3696 RepID=A0A8T2WSR7_POPDE|nr:hypothetical protein H0E87_030024 [Populus deltoides]
MAPVDPFFDTITSPDFSNNNLADSSHTRLVSNTFVQEYKGSISAGLVPPAVAMIHPADAVIENFVKGKVLPQKGKLLQALMEARPLFQTLLLAGPLPQWRNSPPLQPFNIVPVSMSNQNTFANASSLAQKPLASPSYIELRRGYSQKCSSMLNLASCASSSGLDKGYLLNSEHDELKQKLVHFTIESESIKVEANEEMRKNKEDVEHLIHLLKIVTKKD